jgi:alginate O-acetyltransferase complex protein AlgJ
MKTLPEALKTPKHTLICAAVFSALMLAGTAQMIGAVRQPAGLDFPKEFTAFREGKTTQTLEKQLDKKMPGRSDLITLANSTRYFLLGGAGEQVRAGKNDWLFLTEELRFEGPKANTHSTTKTNNPDLALAARITLINQLSQDLRAVGVKLIVALVPDKARVYATHLKTSYPSFNESRYSAALAALKAKNVAVVDLLKPMQRWEQSKGDLYYRTDTHWNQTGAALAANEIASKINLLKLDYVKSNFVTATANKAQERSGDLIRLMGLESAPSWLKPKLDLEAIQTTAQQQSTQPTDNLTTTGQASANSLGSSLFDEVAVPIVLVGTSYSLRANFHGKLQELLGTSVLNTAKDGGGFLQAITAYLNDDSFKTSKPQVIIWELPERMLKSPLDQEVGWSEKIKAKITSAKP